MTNAIATSALLMGLAVSPTSTRTGSDFVELFTPESIRADHTRNTRWSPDGQAKSHDQADITALAHSILEASARIDESLPAYAVVKTTGPDGNEIEVMNFKTGQQAPGGYHWEQDPDDPASRVPVLRYGFGRYEAIDLINQNPVLFAEALKSRLGLTPEDFDGGEDGSPPRFEYPFAAKDRTGVDPLTDNILENGSRVHLSDMDWSNICQRLRYDGDVKRSTSEISALLAPFKPVKDGAPSASWVDQHLELQKCSKRVQALVHQGVNNGGMSVWTACQMRRNADKVIKAVDESERGDDDKQQMDLEAEMDRVLDTQIDAEGNYDAKGARTTNRARAAETGATTTKTVTEVRRMFTTYAAEGGPQSVIATTIIGWMDSQIPDEKMQAMLEKETVSNVKPGAVAAWKKRVADEQEAKAAEKAEKVKADDAGAAEGKRVAPKKADSAKSGAKVAAEGKSTGAKAKADSKPAKGAAGSKPAADKPSKGGRTTAAEAAKGATLEA